MKKAFWVIYTIIVVSICVACLAASDSSAPEFEDSPISASGSFRWEEETIYLDITITNMTNKDIYRIGGKQESWRVCDGETDWRYASFGGAGFASPPGVFKAKTIKPGASTTRSYSVSSSVFENEETKEILDYIACKTKLSIDTIHFGPNGLIRFESDSVVFDFEGYKDGGMNEMRVV